MLSYNSTYTCSITNSPCTPPESCTLDSIPHSGTLLTHMGIPLYMHRFITSTHRTLAHALHATTSTCAITPTATAYAPNNLHPGGRTRHIRTEQQPQCSTPYTYNTHTHRDYAYAYHLHVHLGCSALPSAICILRAASSLPQHNIPYRDAAYAPQRTAVAIVA